MVEIHYAPGVMEIPLYQVDAFTKKLFGGNPAAVCPLDSWLDDDTLQSIAAENNLSETAFFVPQNGAFHLRWFTPKVEVDLCGHATLASAYVLFMENPSLEKVEFDTRSGRLVVYNDGDFLRMDFPALPLKPVDLPEPLADWLGRDIVGCFERLYLMVVFPEAKKVADLVPDQDALLRVDIFGLIVTARGDGPDCDFVSRFFAPKAGIPEDPVTGSAHCLLTPYWSKVLGKKQLEAIQISSRRGYIRCIHRGDRVELRGQARLYAKGRIFL